jgi:hypothetical protein
VDCAQRQRQPGELLLLLLVLPAVGYDCCYLLSVTTAVVRCRLGHDQTAPAA